VKDQELYNHLADLARRLGFEVRTDQGPFRDGACRVEERRVIILNRASPVQRKVAALGRALSACPLEGIFLLPAVREVIERARNGSGPQAAPDPPPDSGEPIP